MTNAHDIDCDIDRDTPAAADIRAVEMADPRKSLSRGECQTEGNWGPSTQRLKEQSGVLHRYNDNSAVRITARSFYQHLIDLANAPPRRGRKPSGTSFQKKRREPTPAELAGLRKANDARKVDKQRRWPPRAVEVVHRFYREPLRAPARAVAAPPVMTEVDQAKHHYEAAKYHSDAVQPRIDAALRILADIDSRAARVTSMRGIVANLGVAAE